MALLKARPRVPSGRIRSARHSLVRHFRASARRGCPGRHRLGRGTSGVRRKGKGRGSLWYAYMYCFRGLVSE
ncbi:hypothetical protein BAUCODRAFT_262923 [Baudoinia panamericana UAMH 10762]|uniref:Uncharacterized protein n=1 Tax=Baudoinia panamericana (strain UAMH 10762) TaxID=717646 RepID=M2LFI3_BAUPA|nr:uncharacterized protein BAUCODRAFT_262923 [Baudoinia panamericana UAMH 10762]EMC92802.1 hypothetical protein BAUCODRAFT_262923 [Baudoinia panamericana UAMH 10762]